ncbi:hypothetical protein HY480_00375 [Candidatus Uhrbacteria bacterium]|nr:hypothetical protein [Candidatus Uhrbacteria bacterium]
MGIIRTIITIAAIAGATLVWNRVSIDVQRPAAEPVPAFVRQPSKGLAINRRTVNGRTYTVFVGPHVRLALTRPSREDPRVLLAVAGTYTSPRDTVEGYVVHGGRVVQASERQGWDGAVIFRPSRVEILQTENGRLLTRTLLANLAAHDASLVQTHLLVYGWDPIRFKPQPALPRRALAIFTNNAAAIIESADATDLTTFAADLAALGIRDAANLDMGTWSEGWYRDPATGAITMLGIPNPATARQTNWIVLEER